MPTHKQGPDDCSSSPLPFACGNCASESEVIRDGLRALQARDKAVEQWLRNDVVAAHEALKADPSRGTSLDDARTALEARHARASKTARP